MDNSKHETEEYTSSENTIETYEGSVVDPVNDMTGKADAFMGKMNQALEVYERSKQLTEKRKAVEAWSKVKITETVAKYKACEDFLNHTFGERDKALSKYYDLLDKAVESDDKDLIISALQGISGIVTSSPLSDFKEFARLWEDTSQPLLDF